MSTSTPLTGLPPLLRAAGLAVYEVPGWETRSAGTYGPWLGVLNHHTASRISPRTFTPALSICIYGRTDLAGPLCNIYGGRDRKIYMVAAGRANHSGVGGLSGIPSGNRNLVGIEWENDGIGEAWDNLLPTMIATNAVILDYLRVDRDNAWDHKEWAPRRKPDRAGITPSTFRSQVTVWRPTPPKPLRPIVSSGDLPMSEVEALRAEIARLSQRETDRNAQEQARYDYQVETDRKLFAALGELHSTVEALRAEVAAMKPADQ